MDKISLKTIYRAALVYAGLGLVVMSLLAQTPEMVFGFAVGVVLALANLFLLVRLVKGLTESASAGGAFLLSFKLVVMMALAAALILMLDLNAIAFAAGFFSLIFGIFYLGFKNLLTGSAFYGT